MLLARLALICAVFALAARVSSAGGLDADYAAHASRYSDAMTAAMHDYQAGRISETEMQARLRAAGEELALSDAATGREEQHMAAAQTLTPSAPQTPSKPETPAPQAETDNPCFLISCAPPATAPIAASTPVSTSATPLQPATPAAVKPVEDRNHCLFISCP
ncbi:MAG: hypothetical protein ABSD74_10535 [Rhizomicrobium sp.]|jgi:hypothetical protein